MNKHFSIFGNPIAHSFSPKMHTFAIEGLGVKATYDKTLLVDGKKLKEIFFEKKLDGANVTVPYKEEAFKQADEVRGIAKKIGAVNTLVLEDNKIVAYNTDAEGFFESIKEFGDINSILILGAGGTAKAISLIFKEKNIKVTIVNRGKKRLIPFEEKGFKCYSWDEFTPESYDLVVNTTSAGLSDSNYPTPKELLEDIFKNTKYAVDVIYNKKTPFLQLARKYCIPSKDGSDMLLYQGVKAFNLFYHNKFDEKEITRFMKKAFR